MPSRRFPPPWSVDERGAKRKPRGTTGAKKNTRVELFYAVGSPFVITRGCHPRYGREVANGHPVPPAGDAIELAGAVYIVPSPFGLGSVPLPGVRAKKLVSGRIDVLAGAIVIYLTVDRSQNAPRQRPDSMCIGLPSAPGHIPMTEYDPDMIPSLC